MIYKKLLILMAVPVIAACTGSEPVPFKVGKDGCDHCKMTIMSNKYGIELITAKGKVYKFDDISCGVTYSEKNAADGNKIYVADHQSGKLIDAKTAVYLKSDKNRTPMNSMIVAFSNSQDAEKMQKSKGGEILSWQQVSDLY